MSVLAIRTLGDPVLRCRASEVGEITDEIRTLAADMIETMYDAPGRGLAAPQVGRSLRLFVMDALWKDGTDRAPLVAINPRIVASSAGMRIFDEGCLSIPGITVPVERPARVTLGWTDLDGMAQQGALEGIEAVCAQHEYNHLEGVLNIDRLSDAARADIADRLAALET